MQSNVLEKVRVPSVVYSDSIKKWHIDGLLNGEVDVVRISNYYSPESCELLTAKLKGSDHYGHYANAPKIARVGMAFFEGQVSEVSMANYWKNAMTWLSSIRNLAEPYLTPVDRLRLELDEIWSAGAKLATIDKNKLFAGLAREFTEGSNAEPHQDVLSWDVCGELSTDICNQLAANVYLSIPEKGGDLLLWDSYLTQDEYENNKIPGSYGVNQAYIGMPSVRVSPRVGELILFNSTRVHAVDSIMKGSRMSWSCFIGYSCTDMPLQFWS